MAEVDAVILCLPDDAAMEAVKLADELGANAPRILDASTAHRVAQGWVYGFAELHPTQRDMIKGAHRVSNPGCYPTGAIALIRPLVDAGFILPTYPVTVNAVSGYSGGGKSMIEAYERALRRILNSMVWALLTNIFLNCKNIRIWINARSLCPRLAISGRAWW